jgi:hypothetical protein
VQVQGDQLVKPRAPKQPTNNLSGPCITGAATLLLAGVAEVGDEPNHPFSACCADRISQQRQHHKMIVHWWEGWLNNECDSVAHVLANMHPYLTVGEASDLGRHNRRLELAA